MTTSSSTSNITVTRSYQRKITPKTKKTINSPRKVSYNTGSFVNGVMSDMTKLHDVLKVFNVYQIKTETSSNSTIRSASSRQREMITLEEDLKTATNEIKMVVQEQKTLYRNKLQQQYQQIKQLETQLGRARVDQETFEGQHRAQVQSLNEKLIESIGDIGADMDQMKTMLHEMKIDHTYII